MVMGEDSCSNGCEFESWHNILDGYFFTFICCKNCNVGLKKTKINEKEAGFGPFFYHKLNIPSASVEETSLKRLPSGSSLYIATLCLSSSTKVAMSASI